MRNALSYIAIGTALLLWAGSLPALAIYRWVDEAGVVHFSDMPSAEAAYPFKTVEVKETRVSDSRPGQETDEIEAASQTSTSLREELDELRKELRAQREAARERWIGVPLQVVQIPRPAGHGWPYEYRRIHRHSAKPDIPRPRPQSRPIKTATWKPPGGL